ncbi:DMT family transporter [Pedobacter aquatilis]|uniref:DMT family transporter n=1 Tax=Pedobacter aquatilis TaxID=351343 RepID=UPI00292E3724|nr:DMT family transporter [Pedobacter aquatilis]
MKGKFKKILFTVLTVGVVIVWGTTFASSKVLMDKGMDTIDILFVSFFIAYLSALTVSRKKLWSDNLKDEIIHCLCGLIGGAGYYLTQVEALKYTLTTNVSIIVTAAPILTAILAYFIFKEKFSKQMLIGSVIALSGAVLVVFNGKFELDVDLTGNVLSISAALSWAIYSILLKILGQKYSTPFTIRKVFFYGLIGLLVYSVFHPLNIAIDMLSDMTVIGNLIYLGLISSLVCYLIWGLAIKELDPTKTANFMYLQPFATLLIGYFLLNENITAFSIVGLLLILGGVYLTERISTNA